MTMGDKRKSVAVTNDQNIVFNAGGAGVLVQLASDGYSGKVDFQTSVDGVIYYNIPYVDRVKPGALATTDQIVPGGLSTPRLYYLQGPLSQVRIKCSGLSAGELTVVYRTILGDTLDRRQARYDYIMHSRERLPVIDHDVAGLTLFQYDTNRVYTAVGGRWVITGEGSLATMENSLLEIQKTTAESLAVLRRIAAEPQPDEGEGH